MVRRAPATSGAAEGVAGSADSIETPDKANATFIAGFALPMDDLHPDYPALVLANHILGGSSAGRLFVRVREQQGLSYGVFSHFRADMLDPNAELGVNGICNPNNMPKVKQLIVEEVSKLAAQGVTKDELEEAKRSYLEQRGMSRPQDAALGRILSGQLYAGRTMQQEADFEAKLKALTPEQVSAATKKYVAPDKLVIVTAGDFANASRYAGDAKPGAAGAGK
jgi:zinc protease